MRWLHRALVLAGVAGFALLVTQSGTKAIARDAAALGAGVAVVVAMAFFEHALHALAWGRCFAPSRRPPALRLLGAYLGGYTVNLVTPTATLGGEVVRAGLLPGNLSAHEIVASVAADRLAIAVADTAIGVAGFALLVTQAPLGGAARASLGAGALLLVAGVAGFLLLQRSGRLARSFGERSAVRWLAGPPLAERLAAAAREIDGRLLELHGERAGDFRAALLLHLAGTSVGAFQLAVFLAWLDVQFGLAALCTAFTVATALDLLSFFVPARLGAQEASRMLGMSVAGIDPARGLSFSLVLRAEQIFWAGVGLLLVPLLAKRPLQSATAPVAAQPAAGEHPARVAEAPLEKGGAC